eukprot:m.228188 g.228188  ORF g.228188 m.228188 type:complete len:946 (+) comp33538_c0_seq1:302-3139(+)
MPRNYESNLTCVKCLAPRGTTEKLRPQPQEQGQDDADNAVKHADVAEDVAEDMRPQVPIVAIPSPAPAPSPSPTVAVVSSVTHVRNVSVIAHVDHGKTTVCDALISHAGLLNSDKAGDQDTGRSLDTTKEERERGITIKATGITLDYEMKNSILDLAQRNATARTTLDSTSTSSTSPPPTTTPAAALIVSTVSASSPFEINLIDSPGHVDFSGEVSSALRMTDGALVVVDVVDGKSSQTETVLLQAIQERVRPVLMLNKVDRLILEKQLSPEDVYDRFVQVIAQINNTISEHLPSDQPEILLSLAAGNVAFGSGYFQWSATVDTFADMLKPGLDASERPKFLRNLAKKENFVRLILKPIFKIHEELGLCATTVDHSNTDGDATITAAWIHRFNTRMQKVGRPVSCAIKIDEVATLPPRKTLKKLMSIFLPAAEPLLQMIALHLPSPIEAMRLRTSHLYNNVDEAHTAMLNTTVDGPTLVYVSKMVHPGDVGSKRGGLLAVSRVFAGTVNPGDVLHVAGTSTTVKIGSIQQCVGKTMRSIERAVAGQIVAFTGISSGIRKNATLSSSAAYQPIKGMSYSVSPVVQKAISPTDPRQLKKMVSVMREIVQADQTALFYQHQETQQYVLAGAGELHLEVILHALDDRGVKTRVSDPMVNFREGITVASSGTALKKTTNKLNRLWFRATPLTPALVEDLESETIVTSDLKALAHELGSRHAWDKNSANRVWSAAPEFKNVDSGDASGPTCLLVNSTVGLQIPGDVRDSIVSAFQQVVREGLLAGAQLRGVRFDLVDAKFHTESTHRSSPQMLPAAKSAMRGALMLSQPVLIEPLFKVEVSGHGGITAAYSILGQRRARILEETIGERSGLVECIKAELPVRMSFGMLDEMRGATSGKAFVTTAFGGWGVVDGDVTAVDGGEARGLVEAERKAKRIMPAAVPVTNDFVDKL